MEWGVSAKGREFSFGCMISVGDLKVRELEMSHHSVSTYKAINSTIYKSEFYGL